MSGPRTILGSLLPGLALFCLAGCTGTVNHASADGAVDAAGADSDASSPGADAGVDASDFDSSAGGCTGPSAQPCAIAHGTGTQDRSCSSGAWSAWGACQVLSCDSGYVASGNACVPFTGTLYHIDPGGADSAGRDGSSASPWKTLAYACSRVTTAGDMIHVNAGSYLETSPCDLAEGVSIEGEPGASNIVSHVGGTSFTISLASSAENTPGNQHVSGLSLDGDHLTAHGAIQVLNRGNVEIRDCQIVDFDSWGVSFYNGEPPTDYATGNTLHGNTITNCASFYGGAQGNIQVNGQDGLEIFENTVTQDRGTDDGDVIYGVEGYVKNLKIHHNTFAKTFTPGVSSWDFAIEIWNWLGGNEIYDNTITGSIDVVLASKGASTYSVWIHDNVIRQPELKAHQGVRGVLFEYQAADAIVERNLIENVVEGIYFQQANGVRPVSNVTIRYNVFANIGGAPGVPDPSGWGIYFSEEDYNDPVTDFAVYNNTIVAHQGGVATAWGISLPDVGAASRVSVRNNIVQGFGMAPVAASGTGGTTIDVLSIENNIFYGNGMDTPYYMNGMSPTNDTTQNNSTSAPPFVSAIDFHLTAARPGIFIAAGLVDKDGKSVANPPTIGAYEYP